MKKNEGFSLYEVMAAVAVFSIVMTATVPLLIIVYRERITIDEEQQALEMLHNEIETWLLSRSVTLPENKTLRTRSTVFHVMTEKSSSNTARFCISWDGSNERRYEQCGYVKPWP